ncbi:MAG: hypothetical protein RIC51_09215 [Erythrobacter sp.]|uniref:hypothetical protein n=1 Tax=Erythrobacter sp. TaxID=1042 RepID=UPI0032ED84BD
MSETGLAFLQWYGAGAGLLAALMVSLNLGAKVSGWGFVVFLTSSIALVAWGFLNDEGQAVGYQNIGLFAINVLGVYRYLIAGRDEDTPETEEPTA